jgi:hypothetical protein
MFGSTIARSTIGEADVLLVCLVSLPGALPRLGLEVVSAPQVLLAVDFAAGVALVEDAERGA